MPARVRLIDEKLKTTRFSTHGTRVESDEGQPLWRAVRGPIRGPIRGHCRAETFSVDRVGFESMDTQAGELSCEVERKQADIGSNIQKYPVGRQVLEKRAPLSGFVVVEASLLSPDHVERRAALIARIHEKDEAVAKAQGSGAGKPVADGTLEPAMAGDGKDPGIHWEQASRNRGEGEIKLTTSRGIDLRRVLKHVVENRNPFPIQVFTTLAIGVGTSSLWLGPVIHSLWERSQVPTSRVLPYWQAYGHWSVGLGIGILGFALLARSLRSSRVSDALVLFTCLALILLADRALLGVWGLPIWVPDRKLIYRLRPNQIDGKVWMRTNAYGQYDGEFRGLFVGDSVTMGHGVDSSHVFSRQLENLLRSSGTRFGVHRMINTGVQGYSTEQEYEMLRESMAFHPDFVAIGFCMNDLTEPFTVDHDHDLGGAGIVYGEVIQFKNPVISYLANETGFGQALLRLPRIVRHLHHLSFS